MNEQQIIEDYNDLSIEERCYLVRIINILAKVDSDLFNNLSQFFLNITYQLPYQNTISIIKPTELADVVDNVYLMKMLLKLAKLSRTKVALCSHFSKYYKKKLIDKKISDENIKFKLSNFKKTLLKLALTNNMMHLKNKYIDSQDRRIHNEIIKYQSIPQLINNANDNLFNNIPKNIYNVSNMNYLNNLNEDQLNKLYDDLHPFTLK